MKRNYVREKLKSINKGKRIALFFCFLFLPLICCEALCLVWGTTIGKLSLYGAIGNDEVVYHKMIEGVLQYGMPKGYFGYNESHAVIGTFSTWSPVLLLPWTIFGLLSGGGWKTGSPIIYNILMLIMSMGAFYCLAKPNWKQAVRLFCFYSLTPFISWYAFATLPEISVYSFIILFSGLYINICHTDRLWKIKLGLCFFLTILLTWMRPYYIMLILLPGMQLIWKSKNRIRGIIITGLMLLIAGVGYIWIYRNMCAAYLNELLDVSLFSMLFKNPIEGVRSIISTFMLSCKDYLRYVREGILGQSLSGAFSVGMLIVIICFCIQFRKDIKRKVWEKVIETGIIIVFIFFTFCAAAVVFDIGAGCKHFAELVVLGIFILGMKNEKDILIILGVCFSWIFFFQIDYYGCVPNHYELEVCIEDGREQLSETIVINKEADPWENTVIWVFSDEAGGSWQELYAFPAGVGINLCTAEYVSEHWGELHSRYIYTPIGGSIDKRCEEYGMILIAEYGVIHVYDLKGR